MSQSLTFTHNHTQCTPPHSKSLSNNRWQLLNHVATVTGFSNLPRVHACVWWLLKRKFRFHRSHNLRPYDAAKKFFLPLLVYESLSMSKETSCRQQCVSCRLLLLLRYCTDTCRLQMIYIIFIFSQTFYLITVPGHLLVLPLPVCFRGNPSFVSQGSSANWENLNLSSELKQLEHIWLRRVAAKCISQHSRLVITYALGATHCKSSTVKQFPELSITVPEMCCNTRVTEGPGDWSIKCLTP